MAGSMFDVVVLCSLVLWYACCCMIYTASITQQVYHKPRLHKTTTSNIGPAILEEYIKQIISHQDKMSMIITAH
jgi:hypothetical protein